MGVLEVISGPEPWSDESSLEQVAPENLFAALKECGPMLAAATERSHGRWDLGSVVDKIVTGDLVLWVSRRAGKIEGCACTRIERFPRTKEMSIPFVGGSVMKNWLRFEEELADRARTVGCTRLIGYDCRGGAWLRVLKGWTLSHREIVRTL